MYCRIIINIHKTLISVDFEEHLTTWIKMGISFDTMITIFFSCQQVINNSKSLKSMIFLTHQIHLQKFVIAIYSTSNSEIKTQLIKSYPKESCIFSTIVLSIEHTLWVGELWKLSRLSPTWFSSKCGAYSCCICFWTSR